METMEPSPLVGRAHRTTERHFGDPAPVQAFCHCLAGAFPKNEILTWIRDKLTTDNRTPLIRAADAPGAQPVYPPFVHALW